MGDGELQPTSTNAIAPEMMTLTEDIGVPRSPVVYARIPSLDVTCFDLASPVGSSSLVAGLA